jgi:hypothetical protein
MQVDKTEEGHGIVSPVWASKNSEQEVQGKTALMRGPE